MLALNAGADIRVHNGAVTSELLSAVDALVVTTASTLSELEKMNSVCRAQSNRVVFLAGIVTGALATVFADFGAEHTVCRPSVCDVC